MSEISNFVSVNIAIQDRAPSADSFGVIMAVVHIPGKVGVLQYTTDSDGLSAMTADGITSDAVARAMLRAASVQSPRVPSMKFFSRPAAHAALYQFVPTAKGAGYKHSIDFSVDGLTYLTASYPEIVGDTPTLITTGMKAAVDALALAITCSNAATTSFTVVHTSAAKKVYFHNVSPSFAITDQSTDTALGTDVQAAIDLDNNFYGLVVDSTLESALNAARAVADANEKVFIGQSVDTGVGTNSTTDVGSDFLAAGTSRSTVAYSTDPGAFLSLGTLARQLALIPGSSTFHAQDIKGVIPENLSTSQITNLRAKNVFFLSLVMSLRMTYDGKAGGGRFLDITLGADWLTFNLRALNLAVMANTEKPGYDDSGMALFECATRSALDLSVQNGFLQPGYTLIVPKLPSGATVLQRTNRQFPPIKFSGTLTGAGQYLPLSGVLQP